MIRTAEISKCGLYRYSLIRKWGSGNRMMGFVCWNPSIADSKVDDPSLRRMIGFGIREGFDGIQVGNLYAFRATKPKDLWNTKDPVGPCNMEALITLLSKSEKVIVGWGASAGMTPQRQKFLLAADNMDLYCLGTTKSGEPRHPLYVRSDVPITIWRTRAKP